jgi:hypothetical protein
MRWKFLHSTPAVVSNLAPSDIPFVYLRSHFMNVKITFVHCPYIQVTEQYRNVILTFLPLYEKHFRLYMVQAKLQWRKNHRACMTDRKSIYLRCSGLSCFLFTFLSCNSSWQVKSTSLYSHVTKPH